MTATIDSDPRLDYLRTIPIQVCLDYIEDSLSESPAMHMNTFLLGSIPLLRQTKPMEMFDLCVAIVREKAAVVTQANEARSKP